MQGGGHRWNYWDKHLPQLPDWLEERTEEV